MPRPVAFGDFSFDLESDTLYRHGRTVKLHPQPSQLLALLLEHPGELVTRETIQKTLWADGDTFVDFDVGINSCMRQIRAALGDDAGAPRYVETIPKKGYRFVASLDDVVAATPSRQDRSGIVAAAVAVGAIAAAFWWMSREALVDLPESDQHVVVVLPFDNVNQDESLEWLRLGIAELLVTGLSQRPDLTVVPMGSVYQVLQSRGAEGGEVTTTELLDYVGSRVGADSSVHGSFIRAGSSIRIVARTHESGTSGVLATDQADAPEESEIFGTIDLLANQLSARLGFRAPVRPIEEVTTTSLAAYRLYVEGITRWGDDRSTSANVDALERALEIDPNFAEALVRLAEHYYETGQDLEQGRHYAARAMEVADRLPLRARYEAMGRYYSFEQEHWAKAVEAYKNLMTLDPFSHILGNRYRWLERYDECIEVLEGIRRLALTNPNHPSYKPYSTHNVLAACYTAIGEYERAEEVTADNVRAGFPIGFGVPTRFLENELDDVERLLDPSNLRNNVTWALPLVRGDFETAESAIEPFLASPNAQSRWAGRHFRALAALHRGASREALEHLDAAVSELRADHRNVGHSHNLASQILIEHGELDAATRAAESAQSAGRGNEPEWEGLFWAAVASAKRGEIDDARGLAERLRERTKDIPSPKEVRRYEWLRGQIALAASRPAEAVERFERASSLLARHGNRLAVSAEGHQGPPPHAPIWFALASAYQQTGDADGARREFQKIVGGPGELVSWPLQYVRSLYFLAVHHEREGDAAVATRYYQKFYDLWKDGDLDRERVALARKKLNE